MSAKIFLNYLNKCAASYLQEIRRLSSVTQGLVIYGAGGLGHLLYDFLQKNHITINCFCVTGEKFERDYETGLSVCSAEKLAKEGKYAFLIAASLNHKANYSVEMVNNLKMWGIDAYIEMPKYMENFLVKYFQRPVLEITTKIGCPINCKYCPQSLFLKAYEKFPNPIKEMSFDTFKRCIDKVPLNTVIFFSGFSEPFLCKAVVKMIQYAARCGYDISLATTLVGMSESDFETIKDISFLEVVLHAPDREKFANIPMTDEYLELFSKFVNTRINGRRLINYVTCQGTPNERIDDLLRRANVRLNLELHDRAGNLSGENLQVCPQKGDKLLCGRSIDMNWNELLPNGEMILCSMDFGLRHRLGNLYNKPYEEIISGTVMKEIKAGMSDRIANVLCRNCVFSIEI